MKMFKVMAVLVMLFSATIINAQTPQVVPYPAIECGQTLTIDATHSLYNDVIATAEESRQLAISELATGGTPTAIWTCNGDVCCQTVPFWCPLHNKAEYTTTCVINGGGTIEIRQ